VPFRADVSVVIGGLAKEGNALGLWLLAHAAQRFEASTMPSNTSARPRLGLPPGGTQPYQHVMVDLSAPDRVAREGGVEKALSTWDVVYASDEARAKERMRALTPPPVSPSAAAATPNSLAPLAPATGTPNLRKPSKAQQIEDQRQALTRQLEDAKDTLRTLEDLGRDRTFPPLLGATEEWSKLQRAALDILTTVDGHNPDKAEEDSEDSEEEDDEATSA
jgi:hypothetical protein